MTCFSRPRVWLLGACAGRCREVQGGAGRCREVQGGAGRCREVQGGAGRCRRLLALDLCLNTTVALTLVQPISSSCSPSLCLCAAPQMFLHLRYLSRHWSLTPPLLKINNHSSMFIIAHFHTQPARNNHLGVCVRDRKTESEGETQRRKQPEERWSVKTRQNKETKSRRTRDATEGENWGGNMPRAHMCMCRT